MNIRQLRKKFKLSQQALSDATGIPKGRINGWEQQGTSPKVDDYNKLQEYFNSLENNHSHNESGLIVEKSDPFLESSKKEVILLGKHRGSERMTADEVRNSYEHWDGLPMYNEPITASFVATYRDSKLHTPQYYLYDPRFRDCNFGAVITGDSMHSEIRHGDFVACKEIKDYSFIAFGEIYYVVTKNGLETCKYVQRCLRKDAVQNKHGRYDESQYDDDKILLVPYNKAVDPSPLHRSMIERIYKVRGIVRGY